MPLALIPFVENPLPHLPAGTRLLTAMTVLGYGLSLLAWPRGLSPDYSWNALPPVTSPLDPAFLASLAVLVALAAGALLLRRSRPALAFLILWYAGAVFPTSNLLIPIGTVFGDRLLYLPSVAFCLAAGLLLQGLLARPAWWPRLAGVALLLLLTWQTVAYAGAWRDEVALFTAAVEAQPGSAKAHELLGAALMEEDRAEEGVRQLELAVKALADLPEPPQAQRVKLGVAYERQGRLGEAEALYQEILRQTPGFADATWRLGVVRWRQGKRDQAARLWEQAVAQQPDHARAMTDLGLALQERGDLDGAEALFRHAAEIDPRTAGPGSRWGTSMPGEVTWRGPGWPGSASSRWPATASIRGSGSGWSSCCARRIPAEASPGRDDGEAYASPGSARPVAPRYRSGSPAPGPGPDLRPPLDSRAVPTTWTPSMLRALCCCLVAMSVALAGPARPDGAQAKGQEILQGGSAVAPEEGCGRSPRQPGPASGEPSPRSRPSATRKLLHDQESRFLKACNACTGMDDCRNEVKAIKAGEKAKGFDPCK